MINQDDVHSHLLDGRILKTITISCYRDYKDGMQDYVNKSVHDEIMSVFYGDILNKLSRLHCEFELLTFQEQHKELGNIINYIQENIEWQQA